MADIELVIKISEDSYKATCSGSMLPPDVKIVVNAIKNGIPLPKGHGDLIDRSKLRPYQFDRNYIYVDDLDNARPILKADKESEETEMDELDFKRPKKIVGKLISVEVLDKIRAEIESQREEVSKKHSEDEGLLNYYFGLNDGLKDARDIIDKYREESE